MVRYRSENSDNFSFEELRNVFCHRPVTF